jgi:agmatine deiminase
MTRLARCRLPLPLSERGRPARSLSERGRPARSLSERGRPARFFPLLAALVLTVGAGVALLRCGVIAAEGPSVPDTSFTFPAEWEPHESIWMGWPPQDYVKGRPFSDVQMEMIRALAGHVKVDLAVQDAAEGERVKSLLAERKVPHDHVRFHAIPHTDIWFRDMGPLFVKDRAGRLAIVDLAFNLWGTVPLDDPSARIDGAVDRIIADRLKVPVHASRMVLEGGALEFNGQGTVLTTEAVVRDRNPKMTLAEAEAELKRLFGVRKVIWLKEGLAEDDSPLRGVLPGRLFTLGTNGHVDEFVRFVDAHTLLLAEVTAAEAEADPIARLSRQRLEAVYQVLSKATDQDGKPFRILRVPAADPIVNTVKPGDYAYDELLAKYEYRDGTKLKKGEPIKVIAATSYLNYLVTNGVVVLARYARPGRPASIGEKDEKVRRLLAECFPDRKIVQINPENVNLGGGGMHCITQQQPVAGK